MSIPYFAFYPKDWLADTGHLSYEERGVYFDLLCHMWVRADASCSLPADDQFLANLLHLPLAKWRKLRTTLIGGPAPVLVVLDGQVVNKRLAQEFAIAQQKSAKATHSARARWQPPDPGADIVPEHTERNANGYAMGYADALPTVCYPDTDKESDKEIDHPNPLDRTNPPSTAPTAQACEDVPPSNTQAITVPVDNFTPFAARCWDAYPARKGKKLHKADFIRRLRAIPSRDWDGVEAAITHYAASSQVQRGFAEDPHRFLAHWDEWQEPEAPDVTERETTRERSRYESPAERRERETFESIASIYGTPAGAYGGHRQEPAALPDGSPDARVIEFDRRRVG